MAAIRFTLAAVVLIVLACTHATAQFPVTLTLDARSADVVQCPPTRADARYRITVQGTYSQWPQFTDCHGVDAVWVYDVPQEEIDAFRWPPKQVLGRPFVEIPHWVGDSTSYKIPPIGLDPLFEISFRKYLGFRINGEPLPAMPLDRVFHRYQHVRAGTGAPFTFQILDSTYNVVQGAVIPRHEDNCGSLTVTIEEIIDRDINICNAEPMVRDGEVVGIRIDASIVGLDSTMPSGTRNLLVEQGQLGIVADGKFICPDSLICDTGRTQPMSFGLLVDVSGSMEELIRYGNRNVRRIDALKTAIHAFLKTLQPGDSLFLMRFSDTVVLVRDWTTDTTAIGAAVDKLSLIGSTALHQGMIAALDKLSAHARPLKALVALTDGLNNRLPFAEEPVRDAIRKSNVPVYLIALGFAQSAEEQEGLATMRRFVQAAPSGKLFITTTGDELEEVYTTLANTVAKEECCRLYFKLGPCDRGQPKRTIRLVYIDGDRIVSKDLRVDCDLKVTSVDIGPSVENDPDVRSAIPTPSDDEAAYLLALPTPAHVRSTLVNTEGRVVSQVDHGILDMGGHRLTLPTVDLAPGMYLWRIATDHAAMTVKVAVRH